MDFSQVKLIVSDMDGTLLNSNNEVSDRFFEIYKELKNKNIQFVAASGRQLFSIKDKLSPIKDEIYVIAENGGITLKADKVLNTYSLSLAKVQQIVEKIREIKDAEIVICGKAKAYIESKNQDFIEFFKEFYVEYAQVENLLEVKDDEFFKIAVYHPTDAEKHIYAEVKNFENQFKVKVSGEHWVDLSGLETHKGNALQQLQDNLGIKKSETMVFGDYNNDLEMLELADFSFAMANAHPNVKAIAKFTTKSNDEFGVETILEKVILPSK
ncbi:HAD family hydrolase [Mesonia aestuariivivens]|uniref:Cof-type HAD-IIB family hydrolase n=1 Tax=Mesonia aestuariivivens TaxID=2796128 RepID=A0ABS6W3C7_9FLAO|nr:HAD family hydrolase [Mesonia aestuariivivens]MBW2962006.1 Cof-type HAD-IIB family hydrolase [Mesonia aestuariivivens]